MRPIPKSIAIPIAVGLLAAWIAELPSPSPPSNAPALRAAAQIWLATQCGDAQAQRDAPRIPADDLLSYTAGFEAIRSAQGKDPACAEARFASGIAPPASDATGRTPIGRWPDPTLLVTFLYRAE